MKMSGKLEKNMNTYMYENNCIITHYVTSILDIAKVTKIELLLFFQQDEGFIFIFENLNFIYK